MGTFNFDDYPVAATGATAGENDFDFSQYPEEPPEDANKSPITTITTGLAQGAVPFASAIAGAGKAGMDAITGTRGPLAGGDFSDIVEDYRDTRDSFAHDAKTAADENPPLAFASNMAGGFANPLFKLLPKTSALAGRAKYSGMEAAKPMVTNLLPKLAGAGAVQSLGTSEADLTQGEFGEAAKDMGTGVLGAGLGYGAAKGIGYGLKKLSPVAEYILKKMGKGLGSIPEQYTEEYLARQGKISARKSEEIADDILATHNERRSQIDQTKDLEQQAAEQLNRSKDVYRSAEQKLADQLADERYSTKLETEAAKETFDDAAMQTTEGLKRKHIQNIAPDIHNAIGMLKDNVNVGSSEAYEILGNAKGGLGVRPILEAVDRQLARFKNRDMFATEGDEAAFNAIQKFRQRIQQYGDSLTYPEAKGILQSIDLETEYNANAGTYDKLINSAKKAVRREMDQAIKSRVPEYGAKMEEVRNNAQLLEDLSDAFGTDSKALGRLGNIHSPKGKALDVPMLERLGKNTGYDFSTPIAEHLRIKDTLSSPTAMKATKQGLPEFGGLETAKGKGAKLADPAYRRKLQQQLEEGPEYQGMTRAEEELLDAKNATQAAKKRFEPVAKFGQGSVQAKMKALTGARDFDAKKLFADLDEVMGKPISQEVKDRAILDAFEKGDTNGARKTLLGGTIGGLVGTAINPGMGTATGTAIGSTTGAFLDKYSGQVIRLMLDGKIGADKAVDQLSKKLGKYAPVIVKAAKQSPEALAVTGSILSKDPDFQKQMGLNQ